MPYAEKSKNLAKIDGLIFMSPREAVQKAKNLWINFIQILHSLDQRLKGWPGIFVRAIQCTFLPRTGLQAAAIAYFALLSLFPLILLIVSISSIWLGNMIDQHQIISNLEFIAPALGQLVGDNVDEIIKSRGTISGFAVISLFWTASSIFYSLNRSFSEIWNHENSPSLWKRRGVALLIVVLIIGPSLFLASFAGSILSSMRKILPEPILALRGGISLFFAIVMDILMFYVLYLLFPHGKSTWKRIIPGAVAVGLLWEVAKKGFLYFISSYLSRSNLVYGSLATIIAFMTWAYISCLLLFLGSYINYYVYNVKVLKRIPDKV
jgi:membrane protein